MRSAVVIGLSCTAPLVEGVQIKTKKVFGLGKSPSMEECCGVIVNVKSTVGKKCVNEFVKKVFDRQPVQCVGEQDLAADEMVMVTKCAAAGHPGELCKEIVPTTVETVPNGMLSSCVEKCQSTYPSRDIDLLQKTFGFFRLLEGSK